MHLRSLGSLGSNTSDRLQAAGLSFVERIASGGPIATVGVRTEVGTNVWGAVAALGPALFALGALWVVFGRK